MTSTLASEKMVLLMIYIKGNYLLSYSCLFYLIILYTVSIVNFIIIYVHQLPFELPMVVIVVGQSVTRYLLTFTDTVSTC